MILIAKFAVLQLLLIHQFFQLKHFWLFYRRKKVKPLFLEFFCYDDRGKDAESFNKFYSKALPKRFRAASWR